MIFFVSVPVAVVSVDFSFCNRSRSRGMDGTEDAPRDSPSPLSHRSPSSFRGGTSTNSVRDTLVLLGRKDAEIQQLKDEIDAMTARLIAAERAAEVSKFDEASVSRKIAKAVESAELALANERRTLQQLAARYGFVSLELMEARSRLNIEVEGMVQIVKIIDDCLSQGRIIESVNAAVRPLRSKLTALNFQLRVIKATEIRNAHRKLAETKCRVFDLEIKAANAETLKQRCAALEAELSQTVSSTTLQDLAATYPRNDGRRSAYSEYDDEVDTQSSGRPLEKPGAAERHSSALVAELQSRLNAVEQDRQTLRDRIAEMQANVPQPPNASLEESRGRAAAALGRLLAPLSRTRLLVDSDDDADPGFEERCEFVKHVLTARLVSIIDALRSVADSSETAVVVDEDPTEEVSTFVNAVFEEAGISELQRRLQVLQDDQLRRPAVRQSPGSPIFLDRPAAPFERIDSAVSAHGTPYERANSASSAQERRGTPYDRLKEEAAERLKLVEDLMAQVEELRATAADRRALHEAELFDLRSENSHLSDDVRRLEGLLAKEKRRCSELEMDLDRAHRKLSDADDSFHKVCADLSEATTEFGTRLEAETQKWRSQVESLSASLAEARRIASDTAKHNAELLSHVEQLKAQHEADMQSSDVSTQEAKSILREQMKQLETENDALRQSSALAAAEVEDLRRLLQTTANRCHILDIELDTLRQNHTELQHSSTREIELLRKDQDTSALEAVHSKEQIDQLREEVDALNRRLSETQSLAETAHEARRQEIADLYEQRLSQQRDHYQTELLALKVGAQKLEMTCAEQVESIERSADERVQALSEEVELSKAKISALEEELLAAAMSINEHSSRAEAFRGKIAHLEQQAEESRQSREMQVRELQQKLADAHHEVAGLHQGLAAAQQWAREAAIDLQNAKTNAADQLLAVKRAYQRELATAEEKLSAATSRIASLDEELLQKKITLENNDLPINNDLTYQKVVVELDKLTLKVDSLQRQLSSEQLRADSLINEKDALSETLSEALANAAGLSAQLAAANARAAELMHHNEHLKEQLATQESLLIEVRTKNRDCLAAQHEAEDVARKADTLLAMRSAELAARAAEHQTVLNSLREAEQLNIDLLARIAETENALDELKLMRQRQALAQSFENSIHAGASSVAPVGQSLATTLSLVDMSEASISCGTTTVEFIEFEVRIAFTEQCNDFFVVARRLRSLLDDAAHNIDVEHKHLHTERRRVQALTDRVASLQAEVKAIEEAWRMSTSRSFNEAMLTLLMEEAQKRRITESLFFVSYSNVLSNTLLRPLWREAQLVTATQSHLLSEQRRAEAADRRAADAEAATADFKEVSRRLRTELAESRELANVWKKQNDTAQDLQQRVADVESDESYCRWATSEGYRAASNAFSFILVMLRDLAEQSSRPNSSSEVRLRHEIHMWRSRCHAIVDLEKASLNAAIDTAVRGRRDNLAPPTSLSLVTLQTLEQMERRLLQQIFFESQFMLAQCTAWC